MAWISIHPIGIALILLGSAFIIGANGASQLTTELEKNKAAADSLNPELQATAYKVEYVGGKFGYMAGAASNAAKETRALRDELLLLESQFAGSLSIGDGGKALRNQLREETRARNAAAEKGAASTAGAAGSAQKAAQEQAARELLAAQEKAARELSAAQEAAARKQEEKLKKRADAYKSFADAVKSTFGGIKESIMSAFSLPDLGNSVNSITRNIKKLLANTKEFARNITSLSKQGLTNDLLQQVIAAGPMQGGRLAAALASAGGGFIGELNQAYGEFGGIASEIAGVGTTAAFANQQTINNYYNIDVKGGVSTGPDIGRSIVNAIKDYERQSGSAWRA
jgi:hypothetical protein